MGPWILTLYFPLLLTVEFMLRGKKYCNALVIYSYFLTKVLLLVYFWWQCQVRMHAIYSLNCMDIFNHLDGILTSLRHFFTLKKITHLPASKTLLNVRWSPKIELDIFTKNLFYAYNSTASLIHAKYVGEGGITQHKLHCLRKFPSILLKPNWPSTVKPIGLTNHIGPASLWWGAAVESSIAMRQWSDCHKEKKMLRSQPPMRNNRLCLWLSMSNPQWLESGSWLS